MKIFFQYSIVQQNSCHQIRNTLQTPKNLEHYTTTLLKDFLHDVFINKPFKKKEIKDILFYIYKKKCWSLPIEMTMFINK